MNRKRLNIPVITLNVNASNDLIKKGITTSNNNKTPMPFVYERHKPESKYTPFIKPTEFSLTRNT